MKIHGARGPVCLPHAVLVFSPELCPTGPKTCHLCFISIFVCENQSMLSFHARKFNLEKESKASQHLGVTEGAPGGMPEGNHGIVPTKFTVAVPSRLPNGHPSAKISPGRGWRGVWTGVWHCRHWGGWIRLAVGTTSEGSSPLLEVEITHTHTHTMTSPNGDSSGSLRMMQDKAQ